MGASATVRPLRCTVTRTGSPPVKLSAQAKFQICDCMGVGAKLSVPPQTELNSRNGFAPRKILAVNASPAALDELSLDRSGADSFTSCPPPITSMTTDKTFPAKISKIWQIQVNPYPADTFPVLRALFRKKPFSQLTAS